MLSGETLATLTFSPGSSITTRILAGCTTGAMAVTCAQPTDVVKIRFQASMCLGPGSDRKYSGTMDAYRTIAREEGIKGLWKGRCGLWTWGLRQSFPYPRSGAGNRVRRLPPWCVLVTLKGYPNQKYHTNQP